MEMPIAFVRTADVVSRPGPVAETEPQVLNVALVSMPWSSVYRPSLAIAILKRCVRSAGFTPTVHLLCMDFAKQIGLPIYERLSETGVVYADWFFAQHLFGPRGLGELANGWQDVADSPLGRELVRTCADPADAKSDVETAAAVCRRLADEEVPRFIDEAMVRTDWGAYDVVGFTTTFSQSLASLALARQIKMRHPHVHIVFGGANVDSEMGVEFIKGFPWIDYVVHGEAEHSFPALLQAIAVGDVGRHVRGVSLRRDGAVIRGDQDVTPLSDLDESPQPDYTDYVAALERIGLTKKVHLRLYLETSRGCWWGAKHHCTFCGLNATTMAYRKKSADRAYAEIMSLSKEYRCLRFSAADNILPVEYYSQLLPRLVDARIDLKMFYEVKANLTREQLRLFRAGGITEIQPGIESFSSRLLQLMRKGVTGLQNIQLLKWCHELDIEPHWNYLYGFPGEHPDDYARIPELFRLLGHLHPPTTVSPVIFERFSPYFFDRDRFGLTLTPWPVYHTIFPAHRVSLDRVAYYFEGRWRDQSGHPEEYIAATRAAWQTWRDEWRTNAIFCYYEKGPDYVRIHDKRRTAGLPASERTVTLSGALAAAYLFCDANHTFGAIAERVRQLFGDSMPEHRLRASLRELVSQGLMYEEGDRFLSLATWREPKSSRG
jgi:ribosomal peptide maturation radical SAM protein 1